MSRTQQYQDFKSRGCCPGGTTHQRPLPGRTYCEACARKFRFAMRLRRGAELPKVATFTIRVRL